MKLTNSKKSMCSTNLNATTKSKTCQKSSSKNKNESSIQMIDSLADLDDDSTARLSNGDHLFSYEDKVKLIQFNYLYGTSWTSIQKLFKNQTAQTIKNHFFGIIRISLRKSFRLFKLNKVLSFVTKNKPKDSALFFKHYCDNMILTKENKSSSDHIRNLMDFIFSSKHEMDYTKFNVDMNILKRALIFTFKNQ